MASSNQLPPMRPTFSRALPPVFLLALGLGAAHAQTAPAISRPSATLTVAEGTASLSLPLSIANPNGTASTVEVALQAFIAAADSPTGQPLLLLANEVSSTISVYGLQVATPTATRPGQAAAPLALYPNPSQPGTPVRLSRPVSGTLCDLTGRLVQTVRAASQLATSGLAPGVYVLRADDGATSKLVVP